MQWAVGVSSIRAYMANGRLGKQRSVDCFAGPEIRESYANVQSLKKNENGIGKLDETG